MISALSGNSALSLLSMFGRSQPSGGSTESRAAQRPPPPPPPPPRQGNGASAQSIFDALVGGTTDGSTQASAASLGDLMNQLVAGLDQDGDGKLSTDELKAGFQKAGGKDDSGLQQLVGNIVANLDKDGDKAVSADELTAGLQQMAASGPPPGGPPPGGPPPGASASDTAASLVSGLDTDGDGKLSAEELAAAFGSQDQQTGATASATANPRKSLQEMLFGLLLDQKAQDQTAQAASLCAA